MTSSTTIKATFLGIGAQKCATTWVHRVLLDHPQAAVSDPKELDFFSAFYDRGLQWYDRHFQSAHALASGEISPSYFHDALAPARAHAYNPDFKIVLTVRDPIARAYSNHLHEVRIAHYRGPDLSFEAGWANNPMYIEQSRYGKHLSNWLTYFPVERVLILLQEEIEAEPLIQAQRLYRFLGLDDHHQSAFLLRRINESYEEKLKGMNTALRGVGKMGRRLGIRPIVDRVKRNRWVRALRKANQRHLNQVVPPMSPQTRNRLIRLLSEDMHAFARMINRNDLPWPSLQQTALEYQVNAR